MNAWRWVDPRIDLVTMSAITAYMQRHGWSISQSSNGSVIRFERPVPDGAQPLVQVIPASDKGSDFVQSITYLITALSELEDRHSVEVLEEMLDRVAAGANRYRQVSAG